MAGFSVSRCHNVALAIILIAPGFFFVRLRPAPSLFEILLRCTPLQRSVSPSRSKT